MKLTWEDDGVLLDSLTRRYRGVESDPLPRASEDSSSLLEVLERLIGTVEHMEAALLAGLRASRNRTFGTNF
jgi:hypothetical protein